MTAEKIYLICYIIGLLWAIGVIVSMLLLARMNKTEKQQANKHKKYRTQ